MKKFWKEKKSLICIILFLGFTTCIFAPYEMYLTNRGELWFRITDFWWIPLVCGGVAMGVAFMLGFCLKGKLRTIYEGGLFAAGIAAYVQGNFLNLQVGVLNGADIPWEQYRLRFVINGLVLCLLAAVILGIACFKKRWFEKAAWIVSAFLTATQAVTLAVMLIPVVIQSGPQEDIGFISDKDLYEVASEENVIVFLVDMFDVAYFREILEEELEVAEQLDGFTFFDNFTGTYSTTIYSVLHLMTGDYFYNEIGWKDWVKQKGEERLWEDELTDEGYELSFYTDDARRIPERLVKASTNYLNAPLRINHYKDFTIDLYRLVMCKYFPDFMKPYIWMDGNELDRWKEPDSEFHAFDTDNISFRDRVNQYGVKVGDAEKQFKLIHINGSHFPYNIDENAKQVASDSVSAVQCARGSLRLVQKYMEEMKANGTYGNAAIIIMADHGYYWDGVLTNPVMLVKPRGTKGNMAVNRTAVCQADFPATVLELVGLNRDHAYGKSVYEWEKGEERERLFYQYYLKEKGNTNYRLIEYKIDSEGNALENFHLTDMEYTVDGRKIVHSEYCRTCQEEIPAEDGYEPPRRVHQKAADYPEP